MKVFGPAASVKFISRKLSPRGGVYVFLCDPDLYCSLSGMLMFIRITNTRVIRITGLVASTFIVKVYRRANLIGERLVNKCVLFAARKFASLSPSSLMDIFIWPVLLSCFFA